MSLEEKTDGKSVESGWLKSTREGVIIRLQIQPRASRSEVSGPHGDRLKIRVAAPPVDGEANEELLDFLKKKLQLNSAQIELVRGHASKSKDILCSGVSEEEIKTRLGCA